LQPSRLSTRWRDVGERSACGHRLPVTAARDRPTPHHLRARLIHRAGYWRPISFAGGRESDSADQVCSADELVDASQRFYKAFTAASGSAVFIPAPAFGDDGHTLFSKNGIPVWTPLVNDFLRRENSHCWQRRFPSPFPIVSRRATWTPRAARRSTASCTSPRTQSSLSRLTDGTRGSTRARPQSGLERTPYDNCRKSAKDACAASLLTTNASITPHSVFHFTKWHESYWFKKLNERARFTVLRK
jgi:hypothetical protein